MLNKINSDRRGAGAGTRGREQRVPSPPSATVARRPQACCGGGGVGVGKGGGLGAYPNIFGTLIYMPGPPSA